MEPSGPVLTCNGIVLPMYYLKCVGVEKRFKHFVGLFITTRKSVTSV